MAKASARTVTRQEVLKCETPVAKSRPDSSSLMCFFPFNVHSSAVGGAVGTSQRR